MVTRSELMARYGLGRSTLEKWYRERAVNGHPEALPGGGRELSWDEAAWASWYRAYTARPRAAGEVTREELAERHGLSVHALKGLWADRAANGHPEPARRHGKAMYWDAAAWAAWYAALPEPEAPDLVTLAEAARILGLAQSTVTVYAGRPPRGWPEPAAEERLAGGRLRRLYRRADIEAYAAR